MDGTTLSLVQNSRTTTITAAGSRTSLVEICEILAWIATACRTSTSTHNISYCRPRLVNKTSLDRALLGLSIDYMDLPEVDDRTTAGQCWHQMVRNPSIAYGYPIPVRHNSEAGLEISLPIMARLGGAPRVIEFDRTLFLKGFCSLFVPMMQIGQSVIWHFLLQADGKRMSYNRGLALERNCNGLSWPGLEQNRHFVGWTPSAKVVAGTKEANYNIELSAGKFSTPGLATLKNVNITAGYFVQVGANIAPGKKDISVTIADSRPYEQQIDAASEMCVILYDTETQKGWLLDGATALLHLTRGWLSSSYDSPNASQAIHKFTCPTTFDGRKSSLVALNLEANRGIELYSRKSRSTDANASESKWCWEQLVEQKWIALEKLHDYIERSSQYIAQLPSGLLPSTLEGFEFLDILSNKATIKSKSIRLDSNAATWLNMVKDNGILAIFGSGFGDLIVHSSSAPVAMNTGCSQQLPVPEYNEFLAAPLYVIRKLAENYDEREDGSISLSDSAYWAKPDTCIRKCSCACKKSRKCLPSLAQLKNDGQLEHVFEAMGKKRKSCPKTDIFRCHPNGAVIFGSGMKISTKKPRKRKQNFNDVMRSNTRVRTSDSGVDVGSSNSSQDISSPYRSQGSIGDSGIPGSPSISSN